MASKQHAPSQKANVAPSTKSAGGKVTAPANQPITAFQHAPINPAQLTPQNVLQLQRTIGNRAVAQFVANRAQPQPAQPSMTISTTTRSPVLQRNRSENPYSQSGDHGGWDLTAHHIVPHSKLVGALKKLSPEQQKAILRYSVPDILTERMMPNLVKYPDSVKTELERAEFRTMLRAKLVSNDDDEVRVNEVRLGDMRQSLFEWQGGNQFQGPNTSIRAEPSSSKDDIDYDGKYFTPMLEGHFKELIGHGEELVGLTKGDDVFEKLKKILDLTKNITPKDFDPNEWEEIGSLDTLNLLSQKKQLDRKHLLKYAFFKIKLSEIGVGKKYDKITYNSGDYAYEGVGKIPLQAKSTDGFIPVNIKDEYTPSKEESKNLKSILDDFKVPIEESGTNNNAYKMTPNANITYKNRKFQVTGFPDEIPYSKEDKGTLEVAKGIIDNRKMKTITKGLSLYDYFVSKNTPTSSFLPKTLYKEIMTD